MHEGPRRDGLKRTVELSEMVCRLLLLVRVWSAAWTSVTIRQTRVRLHLAKPVSHHTPPPPLLTTPTPPQPQALGPDFNALLVSDLGKGAVLLGIDLGAGFLAEVSLS